MIRRAAATSGMSDEASTAARPEVLRLVLLSPSTAHPGGVWAFLAPGEAVPAGAALGSLVDDPSGVLVPDSTTTAGRRAIRIGVASPVRLI